VTDDILSRRTIGSTGSIVIVLSAVTSGVDASVPCQSNTYCLVDNHDIRHRAADTKFDRISTKRFEENEVVESDMGMGMAVIPR